MKGSRGCFGLPATTALSKQLQLLRWDCIMNASVIGVRRAFEILFHTLVTSLWYILLFRVPTRIAVVDKAKTWPGWSKLGGGGQQQDDEEWGGASLINRN